MVDQYYEDIEKGVYDELIARRVNDINEYQDKINGISFRRLAVGSPWTDEDHGVPYARDKLAQ